MSGSRTLKLSDLRPCDGCGGKIAPLFYVVRTEMAVVNTVDANQVLGLRQIFQGSLGLAEAMAPAEPVKLGGPELTTELFFCQECYLEKPLAHAAERRSEQLARTEAMPREGA